MERSSRFAQRWLEVVYQTPQLDYTCTHPVSQVGRHVYADVQRQQMEAQLKAIGSNMASYALLLAIETMSPQIKNILTELNDLAQKLNQSNINSCEIAATTLGAVWPKSDASQNHLCKMIGSEGRYGGFSDYAAARQGCGAEGKRDSVLGAGQTDPRFKSMLGSEFNLAWKAIQENAFLRSDKTLAEFFMSLSGTTLSRKEEGGTPVLHTKEAPSAEWEDNHGIYADHLWRR